MNSRFFLYLGLLCCLSCICACGAKNNKQSEPLSEIQVEQLPTSSKEPVIRDTIVNLSFAGYTLGSAPVLNDFEIKEQSSVTNDKLKVKRVKEDLAFDGYKIPAVIDLVTINDTICKIRGNLDRDIFKTLIDTYVAKYDEPTYGWLKDSYKTETWTKFEWRYSNQSIELYRNATYDWNIEARPMRKDYFFKSIEVEYEDYALYKRYNELWAQQKEYDKMMKPILDSIEAANAKAVQDSLREVERQKRLKDAYQI